MDRLYEAINHIKTRADAWAVKALTDALRDISERLDKALSQEPICIGKVEFDEDKLREIVKEQVARIEITAEQEPCDDAVKVCEIYADVNDCENGAQELCGQCIHYKEPCDDTISRDAVIYYIKGHIHEIITESGTDKNAHTNSILRALINGIETMPSATQKSGKWIPFSERLPKPFEHCLITTTDGEVIYHYDDGQYSKYKAWMPLPKPYEPQESENLGDYPDTIHNQFDNMTGSMNL